MPVLEFAPDATSPYRVQVHLNTHQGPVSVMFNHKVLGSLVTLEEQHAGKNFRLPDSSLLRVSISDGSVQVWCNGQPLLQISTRHVVESQERHLGSGTMVLLVLNALVFGVLVIWFCLDAYFATPASNLFFPLLGAGLLGLFGLIGLFILLSWKKRGLYLVACYAVANLVLTSVFGFIDYRAFLPLVGLILLYFALRLSGLWRTMH